MRTYGFGPLPPEDDPVLRGDVCEHCGASLRWVDNEYEWGDTMHADGQILLCEDCSEEWLEEWER